MKRRSLPTSSIATGITTPATRDRISFRSRWRPARYATSRLTIPTSAAVLARRRRRIRHFSRLKELAFTENLDPEPAISTNADIFTLDLTNPAAKPVKVSTSLGGDFNPAYSPDGKYLAWRSQLRPGYESDKFRLVLYGRVGKTIEICCHTSTTGSMNLSGIRTHSSSTSLPHPKVKNQSSALASTSAWQKLGIYQISFQHPESSLIFILLLTDSG